MKLKNKIKYCCFVLAVFVCVQNTKVNAEPEIVLAPYGLHGAFEFCCLDPMVHIDLDFVQPRFRFLCQEAHKEGFLVGNEDIFIEQANIVKQYFLYTNVQRLKFIDTTLQKGDLAPELRIFFEDLRFGVVMSIARQDVSLRDIYSGLRDISRY
jgi:hypothetical protein